ncbi:unnamed protein product, partial [Schistosoma rodhaini]
MTHSTYHASSPLTHNWHSNTNHTNIISPLTAQMYMKMLFVCRADQRTAELRTTS